MPGSPPNRCAVAGLRRVASVLLVAAAAARAAPPVPAPEVDLRLRQVRLEERGRETRDETRLRVQVRWEARISEEVTVVLGAGTSREDDPVAAEVTLGEGAGDRPVALRAAALAWRPGVAPDLAIQAGKLEPPWVRVSDLVWDEDVRPEGAAARWSRRSGPFDFTAFTGAFHLREDDLDGAERATLRAAQAAVRRRWTDGSWTIVGAGGYATDGTPGDPRPIELFAEGCWELYFPLRGVVHQVVNRGSAREREGWLAGLTLGRARAVHGMEIGWQWRRVEANAVLPEFAGDDLWPGAGRTEHRFRLAYRPAAGVLLALTWSEGRRLGGGRPDGLRAVALEARAEF